MTVFELLEKIYDDEKDLPKKIKIHNLDDNFEEKAIEKIGEVKLINYLKEE